MRVQPLALALLASCLLASAHARAQQPDETTRAAVRSLAAEGDALMDKGDFSGALDRFKRAGSLIPAPTVRLREAMCLEKLGKWIEAADLFRQVSRMQVEAKAPPSFREAIEQAGQQGPALEKRLPKLVIQLKGDDLQGAKVEVDSRELPAAMLETGWPVNPGKHKVVASKGDRRVEVEVQAKESTSLPVDLMLPNPEAPRPTTPVEPAEPPRAAPTTAPPPPRPETDTGRGSAQRTAGWIGLGLGAAGVAAGAITGGLAMSKRSSLQSDGTCQDNKCPTSATDDVNSFNSLRTASTVGFIVGGAGVALGAVLLLSAPSPSDAKPQARVVPWLGLGSAGVTGRF